MAAISILIYIKRNIKQMIKCYVLEIVDDYGLGSRVARVALAPSGAKCFPKNVRAAARERERNKNK